MAASAPPPPPPPPPGPGLMPNLGKSDPSTDVYAPTEASSQIENPGTIEDLHKKCKGISSKRMSRFSSTLRFLFGLTLVIFQFITENFQIDYFLDDQQLIYGFSYLYSFLRCPYCIILYFLIIYIIFSE